jgi:hypothetical protein
MVARAWIVLSALAACAYAADLEIPELPVALNVSGQPVTIRVSGSVATEAQGFNLRLHADMTDLQSHITPLLAAELDQSKKCGERISVEHGRLSPAAPEASLTVELHFEKWACIKAFGKENATKLVGGNGTVHMLLTPRADDNSVRLDARIGDIEADGTLGELLHSEFGNTLREKIRESLRKAIQKSSGLEVVVPEQARPYVKIETVEFGERGSGLLLLNLTGHVAVPPDQAAGILDQFRHRRSEVSPGSVSEDKR